MGIAKENPPARRAAAMGRWLTGATPGSRHRDVQGGTQRAIAAAVTYGVGSLLGVSTT